MDHKVPPEPAIDPENPKVHRWANGLVLIHDFINEEEEAEMISAFHANAEDLRMCGRNRKRISQHCGFHFDYTTFGASTTNFTPVPRYIADLLPRLPIQKDLPDQFTTQYYPPGSGIPPHVDTHSLFAEALYSLSFGSAVPMMFRKCNASDARRMRMPKRSMMSEAELEASRNGSGADAASTDPQQRDQDETWELLLPRRSLLVMLGPARYGYVHGIRGRKTDQIDGKTVSRQGRYSLTMRSIKRGEQVQCRCLFPAVCDARIREEMEQSP